MRARLTMLALAAVCWALVLAPEVLAKQASDNGEGVAGELTDKQVTFYALGVLLFFVFIITFFSVIQRSLEKRKQQRKSAELHTPVGW